jgi:hypothetical protein
MLLPDVYEIESWDLNYFSKLKRILLAGIDCLEDRDEISANKADEARLELDKISRVLRLVEKRMGV